MKTIQWGDIVRTTQLQDIHPKYGMRGIPNIPVGTRCVVVEVVDLPGYDLLVVPEGYKMEVLDEHGVTQEQHTVYLYRGSWMRDTL